MSRQIGDRAVVLGASMAGLLAARVLGGAYARVTVIDRDELPQAPAHRRGVPHGRHVHAVLARVRALRNVAFQDRCDVVGLAARPDRRRVTAARVGLLADVGREAAEFPASGLGSIPSTILTVMAGCDGRPRRVASRAV